MQKKILYSFFIFFYLFTISASSEIIFGKPKVIDGDALYINLKNVRLFGIDAPETNQKCKKLFIR